MTSSVSAESPDGQRERVSFPITLVPKEAFLDLGKGIKLELIFIPAGEFLMGSPDADIDAQSCEQPQHRVRITKPFYLGKRLVTQEQWEAVMGDNPSRFKGPQKPVEQVSWEDCQQFLDRLNAMPCSGGGKFHLPTEAQWEYACRAGSDSRYSFGDDQDQLVRMRGTRTTPAAKRTRWGRKSRTPADSATSTGTCGSGARIGTATDTTRPRRWTIRRARPRARTACTAAAVGSTAPGSAARRFASAACPECATPTSACASARLPRKRLPRRDRLNPPRRGKSNRIAPQTVEQASCRAGK